MFLKNLILLSVNYWSHYIFQSYEINVLKVKIDSVQAIYYENGAILPKIVKSQKNLNTTMSYIWFSMNT